MTRIAFIVFAFTFPVPVPYLIVAFLVVAIVIFIGAILLLRNTGKKKKANANKSGGAAWQPQGQQQGMPGGWNQQGMVAPTDNAWGQQQPGAWAAQSPAQQQQPGAWGAQAPAQQPGAWGAQPPAQQQQPGAWGAQQPAQQPGAWGAQPPAQQQSSPWGSPSTPSSNAANLPGGQGLGGGQPAWDATFAPQQSSAPSQDQWKQAPVSPVEQGASVWGMQNNNPAQQQAPTSYGGGNSGQSWGQANQSAQPAADPWSMPAAQQSAPAQQGWGQPQSPTNPSGNPGMPAWQQGPAQGQGFGSPAAGNVPGGQVAGGYGSPGMFSNNDNDKTMLRPSGPQGGLGMVRVEEGKEPGRVYEVRKEELSIGRSRESDIFLEDLAVSRLHAKIVSLGNGNYALKDEGSANGTKVNGQLVNKYQTYPLQEGDKIQLGQTVLVFARR